MHKKHVYKEKKETTHREISEKKNDTNIINEGKKKASTRLGNGVILRQGIENKCHSHIKEPRTLCKARV